MGKRIDLTGQRFGRLIAIKPTEKRGVNHSIIWLCRCDCGNLKEVNSNNLRKSNTKSCGCLKNEVARKHMRELGLLKVCKHGGSYTRLYRIWGNIKKRCLNANVYEYKNYGGRGIKVCPEWKDSYSAFKFWALLSGYQDNLTIDRIDNDGNYDPNNCQWITRAENTRKGSLNRNKKEPF